MGDLHAKILTRCAELRQLAGAATAGQWEVGADGSATVLLIDGIPTMLLGPDNIVAASPEDIRLIAAFGPAIVLELAAGAEEMCEIHTPETSVVPDSLPTCSGCGPVSWTESENWPCPSLRATARMVGVKVDA